MIARIRQELAILLRTAADKISPPVPIGEWLDIDLWMTSEGRLKPSVGSQVKWTQHPTVTTSVLGLRKDHGYVGTDEPGPSDYDDAIVSRKYSDYPLSHHLPKDDG